MIQSWRIISKNRTTSLSLSLKFITFFWWKFLFHVLCVLLLLWLSSTITSMTWATNHIFCHFLFCKQFLEGRKASFYSCNSFNFQISIRLDNTFWIFGGIVSWRHRMHFNGIDGCSAILSFDWGMCLLKRFRKGHCKRFDQLQRRYLRI